MAELRDDYGFRIVPKTTKINGYTIEPVTFDSGRTVYDVYLGHIFRETFNSMEDAKTYIHQPRF